MLTAGFTATVNADMQVGALEETITVTGETPLVDTQNVRRQTVVSDEMLDTLPTSTKQANSLIALTLGLSGMADVAGIYATQVGGTYHGKGGTRTQFDGMSVQNMTGNAGYQLNAALVQEMTLQSSGISAEGNADGVLINMIPKEGGNTFSGSVGGLYTNEHLASNNLTDELRASAGSPPSTCPNRSTTRRSRSAARSAGTGSGSSRRTASGATRTSSPGPGGTRRRARRSTRPISIARRRGSSGSSRTPCA